MQQQALAQVARSHPRGIAGLDDLQDPFDQLGTYLSAGGDFLDRGLQVAVNIEVADNQRGDLFFFLGQVAKAQLPRQMLGQGLSPSQQVLQGVLAFLVSLAIPRRGKRGHVLIVTLQVRLPVDVFRGGRGCEFLVGHNRLLGSCLFFRPLHHGVLGQLLIDEGIELAARELQDLDGLTQLRRHDQLLRQLLRQSDV